MGDIMGTEKPLKLFPAESYFRYTPLNSDNGAYQLSLEAPILRLERREGANAFALDSGVAAHAVFANDCGDEALCSVLGLSGASVYVDGTLTLFKQDNFETTFRLGTSLRGPYGDLTHSRFEGRFLVEQELYGVLSIGAGVQVVSAMIDEDTEWSPTQDRRIRPVFSLGFTPAIDPKGARIAGAIAGWASRVAGGLVLVTGTGGGSYLRSTR